MSFTATFVMIFLIAFAVIGGVVMFLSKTIDHGEARFGPDGKAIEDKLEGKQPNPVIPAKAGIQSDTERDPELDSGLRRNDELEI
ncbi:hypothetical protein INR77_05235 [Erythrobacter sp. SCSIO 43205]|uniref:hypothetical protein n=1 Tax=Erythrobacter sp. SCSIO 43205 TaxID=2779361 RepID=UPI001CA823DA|nr:hypothetical protein [Erythrobacter sp. SCSIO 43205]UAB79094.1 hypothetical protein INR77_05235 [Erythrobacter sp. SCSIO 43205]